MTTAPNVVTRYLAASNSRNRDDLLGCFTDDAVVSDDGRTMRGLAEIAEWRESINAAFEYTVEVMAVEQTSETTFLVTARVEGTFPGSPVDLKWRFTLRDHLISALDIAP